MSLKDLIKHDIDYVFLNTDEFCDNLTIQVGEHRLLVIGSLQQNLISNNSGSGNVLQSVSWSLYVKYPLEFESVSKLVCAGTRITINDKPFTITEVSDEMGLCRIGLTTRTGR